MGTTEEVVDDGPWRATRLWNSIIRNLQEGIPQKKHRRQLKIYEKCFTGVEATEWLHKHLKKNPNFDAEVSKEQTIRLLQKLVRASVIVPINIDAAQHLSGMFQQYPQPLPNNNGDAQVATSDTTNHIFRANSDLYRLASDAVEQLRTPGKDPTRKRRSQRKSEEYKNIPSSVQRTPLTQIKNNKNDTVGVESVAVSSPASGFRSSFRRNKNKFKKKALNFKENDQYNFNVTDDNEHECNEESNAYSVDRRKHLNLSYLQSLPPNSLVVLDNDRTWSDVFTSQLKLTLSDVHVRGLDVNTMNIIYNMTNVSPKGVVQLKNIVASAYTEKGGTPCNHNQQDLPQWTLSAMKCLANWPKQIKASSEGKEESSTFPSYPGFEQDVFEVVKDYFVGQMNKYGPLTTYKLFDIFVSAYIKAEAIGARTSAFRRKNGSNNQYMNRVNLQQHSSNGYYAETDIDSGCYVQTSTPSSSIEKQPVYGTHKPFIQSSNLGQSTFYKMSRSPQSQEEQYGLSKKNLRRVAKIRQTYEVCPSQSAMQDKGNLQTALNSNVYRSSTNSSASLSPEMSATAIMRNFLPPNTCFETVFMNECPVTRIVPQKGIETLHHLQRNSRMSCAENQDINTNGRKLKCYTPIPSGGSIATGNAWDTRSIATQTEDEEEEKAPLVGKEGKIRSRQPRWKRSVRKRKSIAVMETMNAKHTSGQNASPAKSENGVLSIGQINRGFSLSPLKKNQDHAMDNIHRQRSASTLPYNATKCPINSDFLPSDHIYSNSLDNLLSSHRPSQLYLNNDPSQNLSQPFDGRYSVLVNNLPEVQHQETISPTENMIRSKTVRAEKRKQRDRRERSQERFEDNADVRMNNHEGQHIHPASQIQGSQSMSGCENQYCYVNTGSTNDHGKVNTAMEHISARRNEHYISPNNSKSSSSTLSGSASNYQHRCKSMRPSFPPSNKAHHLFHHQNGLSVKTPLRSCPSLLETSSIPFMDDSNMLYARAEPYQPSLSSEMELESINSKNMSEAGVSSAIASFQLLALLIPPANRRKLQLLLKFMRRLASKEKLRLMLIGGLSSTVKAGQRSCSELVLDVFTETIIKPNQDYSNGDLELSRKIVQFFMDHYEAVWTPPTKLRKEVEERVYQSLVSKRLEAGEDPFPITFCKRVPSKVYEKQKQGQELDTAMLNLLEQILFDVKMSMKEKKKKLKKFKESYPQIYYIRFPTEESEPDYMQTNQNGPITRMSSLAKLKNAIRM